MTAAIGPSRLAWVAVLFVASAARADDASLLAALSCQPVTGPGRVVCELTTRAGAGKLVWSDALVVRAPAFLRPLRSRFVAPPSGVSGGGSAKLGLVASVPGEGRLELLARGVICRDGPVGEWCEPVRTRLTVEIRVPSAKSP